MAGDGTGPWAGGEPTDQIAPPAALISVPARYNLSHMDMNILWVRAGLVALVVLVSLSGCKPNSATCGNGNCEAGENAANCRDCSEPDCGNGVCSPMEELAGTCDKDCVADCGDGTCNTSVGENCATCQDDCGSCIVSCGDGMCDPTQGEACNTCPEDCSACPDENTMALCTDMMDNDADSLTDCLDPDCMPFCLPPCGDGLCENDLGEDCMNCAMDCGACLGACDTAMCDPDVGETCINCPGSCNCGMASCVTALLCLGPCTPGDDTCFLNCYGQTCGLSQGPLYDLIACADTMCSSSCVFGYDNTNCNDCMQASCTAQFNACPFTCDP